MLEMTSFLMLLKELSLVLAGSITVDKVTEIKIVKMCAFPAFNFVKTFALISPFVSKFCLLRYIRANFDVFLLEPARTLPFV